MAMLMTKTIATESYYFLLLYTVKEIEDISTKDISYVLYLYFLSPMETRGY
jgi:hypothetical protein